MDRNVGVTGPPRSPVCCCLISMTPVPAAIRRSVSERKCDRRSGWHRLPPVRCGSKAGAAGGGERCIVQPVSERGGRRCTILFVEVPASDDGGFGHPTTGVHLHGHLHARPHCICAGPFGIGGLDRTEKPGTRIRCSSRRREPRLPFPPAGIGTGVLQWERAVGELEIGFDDSVVGDDDRGKRGGRRRTQVLNLPGWLHLLHLDCFRSPIAKRPVGLRVRRQIRPEIHENEDAAEDNGQGGQKPLAVAGPMGRDPRRAHGQGARDKRKWCRATASRIAQDAEEGLETALFNALRPICSP